MSAGHFGHVEAVGMARQVRRIQSHGAQSAGIPNLVARSAVHRGPAPQVRKGEGSFAIAAESGADERVERLVLRDRKVTAVAGRPSPRHHRRRKKSNLPQKALRHEIPLPPLISRPRAAPAVEQEVKREWRRPTVTILDIEKHTLTGDGAGGELSGSQS